MFRFSFQPLSGACRSLFVVACMVNLGILSAAEDFEFEQRLLSECPNIVKELRERDCEKVGVLKFRVLGPGGRPSEKEGTINRLMADRLEKALLCMKNPLQIAKNASDVAATIPGANHLKQKGLEKLLSQPYEMAWGQGKQELDGLLTGMLELSRDFQRVNVGIMLARKDAEMVMLAYFTAPTDGDMLAEFSESFDSTHRGPRIPTLAEVAEDVRAARTAPLRNKQNANVQLDIYYDGALIPKSKMLEVDGQILIPEPYEHQKVTMALRRLDNANVNLGVVLKVNGFNVLFRETIPCFRCSKYVLKPGCKPVSIKGFTVNLEKFDEFRVASEEESRQLEMQYGQDVGLIQIVVYREASAAATEKVERTRSKGQRNSLRRLEEQLAVDPDVALMAMGNSYPRRPANTVKELQEDLEQNVITSKSRGVMTDGRRQNHSLTKEDHNWDTHPVLSTVIRYRKQPEHQ